MRPVLAVASKRVVLGSKAERQSQASHRPKFSMRFSQRFDKRAIFPVVYVGVAHRNLKALAGKSECGLSICRPKLRDPAYHVLFPSSPACHGPWNKTGSKLSSTCFGNCGAVSVQIEGSFKSDQHTASARNPPSRNTEPQHLHLVPDGGAWLRTGQISARLAAPPGGYSLTPAAAC